MCNPNVKYCKDCKFASSQFYEHGNLRCTKYNEFRPPYKYAQWYRKKHCKYFEEK